MPRRLTLLAGTTLKPCPFCGGQPQVRRNPVEPLFFAIQCDACDCGTEYMNGMKLAYETWNRRTPVQEGRSP